MNTHFASVQMRRMILADLDRVIEIEQSLTAAPHWPRSAYMAALDSKSMPPRIGLVAEIPESGVLAGFAVANLLPPQSELENIAVCREVSLADFSEAAAPSCSTESMMALIFSLISADKASRAAASDSA